MTNKQLSKLVQDAAKAKGYQGIMALTVDSPISYERTRKVWNGVKEAKILDYIEIMDFLGYKLKFIIKGES